MPKRYPSEVRERAVRMVLDRLDGYPSAWAACQDLGNLKRTTPAEVLDAIRAQFPGAPLQIDLTTARWVAQ